MSVRHTVLGLLCTAPMHGYRLRQVAREHSWMYPMANAAIYPSLHGLERDGLIACDTEIHNGRARKVYHVTDAGRDEMSRWLLGPPEPDATARDHMLLKVSMMSDHELTFAKTWLEDAMDQLRVEVETNELRIKSIESGKYARLAMEYKTDMLLLRLRFLERVIGAH
jgi:DNA-binding PadR family transcriptional regulator